MILSAPFSPRPILVSGHIGSVTRYLAAQVTGPLIFFTLASTAITWLRGSLSYLDLVVNRGQSASTFLEFTLLILPAVVLLVLPLALVVATIFTIHRLHSESELVVLWASGLSRYQVIKSLMVVSSIVALLIYALALWINPMAQTILKNRVFEIRGDIAAGVLQEGTFNSPISQLTVYIRERKSGGELLGLLVHDSRNAQRPVTYMAERGLIIRSSDGPRLVMFNGTTQEISRATGELVLLDFTENVFDLQQFAATPASRWHKPDERMLDELLHPDWGIDEQRNFDLLVSEGHKRLSDPLYAFALPLVALFILMFGEFTRRGIWWRVAIALGVIVLVRVTGLGLNAYAVRHVWANILVYVWPMAISGLALYGLSDSAYRLWRRFSARNVDKNPPPDDRESDDLLASQSTGAA
jgi:lipopolysaccharide export system permease protein